MLENVCTLKQINNECYIWADGEDYRDGRNLWYGGLPAYLYNVTKDNYFIISHWQCCKKPAYQIKYIDEYGILYLYGDGSWNGGFGGYLEIYDIYLKDPRPLDELFVY